MFFSQFGNQIVICIGINNMRCYSILDMCFLSNQSYGGVVGLARKCTAGQTVINWMPRTWWWRTYGVNQNHSCVPRDLEGESTLFFAVQMQTAPWCCFSPLICFALFDMLWCSLDSFWVKWLGRGSCLSSIQARPNECWLRFKCWITVISDA